jgi:hypothetical protein
VRGRRGPVWAQECKSAERSQAGRRVVVTDSPDRAAVGAAARAQPTIRSRCDPSTDGQGSGPTDSGPQGPHQEPDMSHPGFHRSLPGRQSWREPTRASAPPRQERLVGLLIPESGAAPSIPARAGRRAIPRSQDERPSITTRSRRPIRRVSLSGSSHRGGRRAHHGYPRPGWAGNPPSACGRAGPVRRYPLMGTTMTDYAGSSDELLRRAGVGDSQALVELFDRHRGRLR